MEHTPYRIPVAAGCILLAFCMNAGGEEQPGARKADTPQAVYDRQAGCASMTAAAVASEDMMSSQSEQERSDARDAVAITGELAQASGKAVGLDPDQIAERIARGKQTILDRFARAAGSPDALEKEKAELGRLVVACALVAAFEKNKREGR